MRYVNVHLEKRNKKLISIAIICFHSLHANTRIRKTYLLSFVFVSSFILLLAKSINQFHRNYFSRSTKSDFHAITNSSLCLTIATKCEKKIKEGIACECISRASPVYQRNPITKKVLVNVNTNSVYI